MGTTGLFAALRTEGKEKLLIVVNLTDETIREHVLPDAYSLKGIFGGDSLPENIAAYETLIFVVE